MYNQKTYLILLTSLISLCACNSSQKKISLEFISKTLTIDNLVLKQNVDYVAKIGFKEENYNYCLPKSIILYIGDDRIDSDKYSYNFDTGDLFIGKKIINDDIKIIAERVVVDGYQVNFETDNNIHFYFYPTEDYDVTPIEDTIAIARDSDGKPIMDGTGEINFKCVVDDNYDTDLFWVHPTSYEIEKVPNQVDIYRISNIKGNIRVCTNTKKIYCKNLCASADYATNSFTFNWEVDCLEKINHFKISVFHNGQTTTTEVSNTNYIFEGVDNEDLYQFTFTPVLKDGTVGSPINKDMMLSPESRASAFPRVEITTENNSLPPYQIATSPAPFNTSVVNNKYVQNIIKIYDDKNELKYDSSALSQEFNGSKIKVRGNTSTVNSNGKESYKIKLAVKADLLEPFVTRGGEATIYQDREWLLLNCGDSLNTLGGFSIEKSLEMSWIPQCQYVTLFMNNDFKGIYVLCEAVNRGENSQSRCPIKEDGFIIENDPYGWKEDVTFQTQLHKDVSKIEYTFKYPDSDKITDEQYQYISNYVKEFEEHFYSVDKTGYDDFIDVDSFARWTVAHDLMHVDDAFGSNMYIYKEDDDDSKLTAGTTWDFDSAFIGNIDPRYPRGLCFHRSSTLYYIRIFKNIPEFINDTREIFTDAKSKIISDFESYISYISENDDVYDVLLTKEALRFNKPQITLFEPQKRQIENFLSVQIKYIEDHPYGPS